MVILLRNKKIILTLLCSLFTFNLFCQSALTNKEIDEIILEIRDRYKEVNNIETDYADYLDEIDYRVTVINWQDSTEGWPGVGHKHSFFEFYWFNRKLIKLVHSNCISDHGIYKEYIFDENEELIFYYVKNFAVASEYEERIYFNKSQLIHYQIKSLITRDDLKLDYRLKELNEIHYTRAKNVLIESTWRINWFDSSAPGLEILEKDTTYLKKLNE